MNLRNASLFCSASQACLVACKLLRLTGMNDSIHRVRIREKERLWAAKRIVTHAALTASGAC
jgi:hypothetical protein